MSYNPSYELQPRSACDIRYEVQDLFISCSHCYGVLLYDWNDELIWDPTTAREAAKLLFRYHMNKHQWNVFTDGATELSSAARRAEAPQGLALVKEAIAEQYTTLCALDLEETDKYMKIMAENMFTAPGAECVLDQSSESGDNDIGDESGSEDTNLLTVPDEECEKHVVDESSDGDKHDDILNRPRLQSINMLETEVDRQIAASKRLEDELARSKAAVKMLEHKLMRVTHGRLDGKSAFERLSDNLARMADFQNTYHRLLANLQTYRYNPKKNDQFDEIKQIGIDLSKLRRQIIESKVLPDSDKLVTVWPLYWGWEVKEDE